MKGHPIKIGKLGGNWTTIELISLESLNDSNYASIIVDNAGYIHVAWYDSTNYSDAGTDNDIFYKRWNVHNDSWTSPVIISSGIENNSWHPALALDYFGNIHLIWADETDINGSGIDYDIFHRYWNATSGHWTSIAVVSIESNDTSEFPAIAADRFGNIHLIWTDQMEYGNAGAEYDIFYKCWNITTNSWTAPELVSTESNSSSYWSTLAITTSGNVHVAWDDWANYSGAGTDCDIFYKYKNATTGNWTTTAVISTESSGQSFRPSIGADNFENIHIIWEDKTSVNGSGTDYDIFYKYRNYTSGTWTSTEVVSTESDDTSYWARMVVDNAANVHTLWSDETNYTNCGDDKDIFYKYKNATTGNWTITEVVSTESINGSSYPAIAVDISNNLHVVWDDSTNYTGCGTDLDIFYRKLTMADQSLNVSIVWKGLLNYNVTSWDCGDINGDEIPEIVAFSRECPILWVFNSSNGQIIWSKNFSELYGDQSWSGYATSEEMKVGDITGDSYPEIIVPSSNSTHKLIYAFNGSGVLLWTYADTGSGKFESVALGDVTGDAINDIAARSPDGNRAHILANNGTLLWTSFPLGPWGRSIHIENLYNSSNENKIITSGSPDVQVINADFSPNWSSSYVIPSGGDELGMGFGDVNGDGLSEIAVQIRPQSAVAGESYIRIFDNSGSEIWTHNYSADYGVLYPDNSDRPIFLDIDSDNQDEILDLVVNYDDYSHVALLLFHGENSSFIWNYNFSGGGVAVSNIGNVLQDIEQEIIVQINDTVFVFDLLGQKLVEFCYNGSFVLGPIVPPRPLVYDFNGNGYEEVCFTNNGTIALLKFADDIASPTIKINMPSEKYYLTPPLMDVDFSDVVSLYKGCYKVDSHTPIGTDTFEWTVIFSDNPNNNYTSNFLMNGSLWDSLNNGIHTVYFKAWDKAKNVMDGPLISWKFYKDIFAPQGSNSLPGNNSYTNDATPNISMNLTDNLSGINASSIVLTVEGIERTHNWDGITVDWTPSIPFSQGQVVDVEVDVLDIAGNSMNTYLWSFTIDFTPPSNIMVISPLEAVNTQTPTVICRVQVSGAGINLSSAQYAYSTTGSLTPTNWVPVDGVYLDSSCQILASDGVTGLLYLKVNAVPFNQYSTTDNTIRFRVSDIANNQVTQSTAAIVPTEEEGLDIILIIIIIGAIAGVASTTYIVVRKRKQAAITIAAKMKEPIPFKAKPSKIVELKREYDYLGGNIRFKIVIRNNSPTIMSKIRAMLTPTDQFNFETDTKNIGTLGPGESRGIDFVLVPMTCGKSHIFGTVSYVDAFGNPVSLTIKPLEIWIKCPLVISSKTDISNLLEWKSQLQNGMSTLSFRGLSRQGAFEIVTNQISSIDLALITLNNDLLKAIYSGITKVTNTKIFIEIQTLEDEVILKVWASDLKQVTGFLAYIKSLVTIALEMSRSLQIKEDKITQQILNAFKFSEEFIQLFLYCESNWTLKDVIKLIAKIITQIQLEFSTLPLDLNKWIPELEKDLSPDATLTGLSAINLEYDAYIYLKKLSEVIQSNMKLYQSAYKDDIATIRLIEEKYETLISTMAELEKRYSKLILNYLLIIDNNSGITLFQHSFSEKSLDPDLLSGFLTAIQDFGAELASKTTSMKKLEYKNFEIELRRSQKFNVALILAGTSTKYLKNNLLKFIDSFERTYKESFETWKGDISEFKDAINLVFIYFLA